MPPKMTPSPQVSAKFCTPKKIVVGAWAMAGQTPGTSQKPLRHRVGSMALPGPAMDRSSEHARMRTKKMGSAVAADSWPVDTQNRGCPTPSKTAETPTSDAAVAGSVVMISRAAQAEILTAIRPAGESRVQQMMKPRATNIRRAYSAGIPLRSSSFGGVLLHQSCIR